MKETVKIKSTAVVKEKDWIETYSMIKQYKVIAEQLGADEAKQFDDYRKQFVETAMKAMNTSNYIAFAEMEDVEDSIVLVELDYMYTGSLLSVTEFFKESDEYYVTLEQV